MHLTDTELEMLADGELRPPLGKVAHRHLTECAVCAGALARREARNRQIGNWLHAVDHAPPATSVDLLVARATAARRRRWPAIAAGIAAVGVAVAGAAAVMPHSPLGAYLGRWTRRDGASPVVQQSPEPGASSVGFTPGSMVTVLFASTQTSGQIVVTLSDSAIVRVAHRAGNANYMVTTEGVVVENTGSRASYEVTVPRATASVHIRVGSRTIFARDGGQLSTAVVPDHDGHYLIRFAALGGSTN
jgi:hypothetical protein